MAFCPKESIYDKIKMVNTPNENMKYTFGSVCVRQCPGKFMSKLVSKHVLLTVAIVITLSI